MGDDETAAIATQLLWVLDSQEGPLSLEELRKQRPGRRVPDGAAIDPVVELLLCHRLVKQG